MGMGERMARGPFFGFSATCDACGGEFMNIDLCFTETSTVCSHCHYGIRSWVPPVVEPSPSQAELDAWVALKTKLRFTHLWRHRQEAWDTLMKEQRSRCAVCRRTNKRHGIELRLDHDHKTGFVRGLLCVGCNLAEGKTDLGFEKYLADPPARQRWIYTDQDGYVRGDDLAPVLLGPARPLVDRLLGESEVPTRENAP